MAIKHFSAIYVGQIDLENVGRDGTPQILPLQSKREVAEAILDAVERSFG